METEKGEEDSDQDEFEETQAELVKEFGKAKKANSEHMEVCFKSKRWQMLRCQVMWMLVSQIVRINKKHERF